MGDDDDYEDSMLSVNKIDKFCSPILRIVANIAPKNGSSPS